MCLSRRTGEASSTNGATRPPTTPGPDHRIHPEGTGEDTANSGGGGHQQPGDNMERGVGPAQDGLRQNGLAQAHVVDQESNDQGIAEELVDGPEQDRSPTVIPGLGHQNRDHAATEQQHDHRGTQAPPAGHPHRQKGPDQCADTAQGNQCSVGGR